MFIGIAATIPDLPNLPGQGGAGPEVTLDYSSSNFCADASDPTLSDASPIGGVFSYTGVGTLDLNTSTGAIDISGSDPGNYTVIYTVVGVGSSNFPINITALDNAAFSYSATSFCKDASNQTPTITTPGGTFTTEDITFYPFQMQFEVPSNTQRTITIKAVVGTSFTVDWGDGYTETSTGSNYRDISHTFNDGNNNAVTNPTISIGGINDTGAFTAFRNGNFSNDDVQNYLLDVPQWGGIQWSSMDKTFKKAQNSSFDISASDTPDFSNLTSLSEMFPAAQMGNISTSGNLSNWDISNITILTYFAINAINGNPDVTGWNTQNVTNAYGAFYNTGTFNRNLSNWSLNANLTNFGFIFSLTSMSIENYTDTIVGWAVTVYKNSAPYSVNMTNQSGRTFDNSRTSDNASGQSYAAKYGSDWTATGWTDAGDARDYLTGATAGWSITSDNRIN